MTNASMKRSTCDRCGSETGKPPRYLPQELHCDPCIALRAEERSAANAWIGECVACRAPVELRGRKAADARRRGHASCSRKCAEAHHAECAARTMAATNRKHASARMKARNPMRRADVRARVSESLRRIGHGPKVRGGNGTGMTEPQALLLEALGLAAGWADEYVVPTRLGKHSGYPSHYKIDLALPSEMIAVEVDGASHSALVRQEQDERKTEFLRSCGWTVVRLTNAEVMEDPKYCAALVWTMARLEREDRAALEAAG